MGIQKQEFYEGAALHQLIRKAGAVHVEYSAPFFVFDQRVRVHLKHSTGKRSPWGFTFTCDEQIFLKKSARSMQIVIGLVCGSDGVVALPYENFAAICAPKPIALRVSCSRSHREHFEVRGPDGALPNKIAPSDWCRILK